MKKVWKIIIYGIAVAMIVAIGLAIFLPSKEEVPQTETIETESGQLGEPDTLVSDSLK